jgi:hypothetical protein
MRQIIIFVRRGRKTEKKQRNRYKHVGCVEINKVKYERSKRKTETETETETD